MVVEFKDIVFKSAILRQAEWRLTWKQHLKREAEDVPSPPGPQAHVSRQRLEQSIRGEPGFHRSKRQSKGSEESLMTERRLQMVDCKYQKTE